ncbi:CGNR zinc finger domain-containing protein [Streptomyces sp. NPDC048664]|uniref:CGNR zinc finger domain-containing protein n=1 Tax=Streptomyces sp. NPDC048664 TaxID=3154505 RepID=UPI003443B361
MATDAATASCELRFDSGRICLDLLATTHPEERLDSVERLRTWITGAALVPPGTPLAGVDAAWLEEFRELRLDLGTLIRGVLDGRPADGAAPAALARLNAAAGQAPPAPCAVPAEDGLLVRRLRAFPERGELLSVVAREAIELLTDPGTRARLRRCEGDNCPLVYLDTSRGRRRRWCSSEVCGNRERVARHRRRAALPRA